MTEQQRSNQVNLGPIGIITGGGLKENLKTRLTIP